VLTPKDIERQAAAKYSAFVAAHFSGAKFFPLEIRFGRPDPTAPLIDLQRQVEALQQGAKSDTKAGYHIESSVRRTRFNLEQRLPTRVWFDGADDYLAYIGKVKEFAGLSADLDAFRREAQASCFVEWSRPNARTFLLRLEPGDGAALGMAVRALHARPQPRCYGREIALPGVSGKFIEAYLGLITQILRECGSPAWKDGDDYHRQLGLLQPPRLIRTRMLDAPESDIGTTFDRFCRPAKVDTVIVVENLRSYLTLPSIPHTLAIYGEGRAGQTLSGVTWLGEVRLFYWGDMDPHGYGILNGLRRTYPNCRSILMGADALDQYWALWSEASVIAKPDYSLLTESEREAAERTNSNCKGVEQEKIPSGEVSNLIVSSVGG